MKGAVVVPEQAVIETQAGPTVYTVDRQGKVAVKRIRLQTSGSGVFPVNEANQF